MSNDYICVFKQFTLCRHYSQGGQLSHGPNKNELLLKRAQTLSDLVRLVVAMANYMSRSSFTFAP